MRRTNAQDRVAMLRAFNAKPVFNTIAGEFQFTNAGGTLNPQRYFYAVRNGAW